MAFKSCFFFVVFFSAAVLSFDQERRSDDTDDELANDYDFGSSWINFLTPTPPMPVDVVDAADVCDFQKWRKLANCTHRNLTSVPKNIPTDTEILDLSINSLYRIRDDDFANLTQLRELYVHSCELNTIDVSAFENLENLEILDLHHNSFRYSDIHDDLFVKNTKLKELNLGINPLYEIPCNALLPLKRLNKLLLFVNKISNPYCKQFPNLTDGAVVSLSGNNLVRMPNFLENSTLSSLNLRGNQIKLVDFRYVATLKTKALDIGFNPLIDLGIGSLFYGVRLNNMLNSLELRSSLVRLIDDMNFELLENKTLDYFGASNNSLTSIPLWTKYLNRVRRLSLADNMIKNISPKAFREMEDLEEVNLDNNQILELKPLDASSRWIAAKLRVLKLARNRLDNIPANVFLGLENLTTLDLHSNPTTYLETKALNGLTRLEELDLSETHVNSIVDGTFQYVRNLKSLNLRDNHFGGAHPRHLLVDLTMLERIDLSGSNLVHFDLWNDYYQISIFSRNTHLQEIYLDNNPNMIHIPSKTFANLTSLSTLSLRNCGLNSIGAGLFRDLFNLTSLTLDKNIISDLPKKLLQNLKRLERFSAAENSLTSLGSSTFKETLSLRYIYLPNNAITFIAGDSVSHLSELRMLDLQGNPLACTCALEPFSDWLKVTNASLVGEQHTICSPASFESVVGSPLVDFQPSSFCGPNIALFVSMPMLSVAFLISIALSYHYRYWIRYRMFMLKISLLGYKRYDARAAGDYEYHLNVMYAGDDQQWVDDHLKPVIIDHFPEKDLHNDMVFGDDDLLPGMYFLDAIHYSVVNSYKTVLLLSNASIRDEWFTTKFRIALEHVNETQIEKVIIVFLERIEDADLPFLVRVFLSKNKPYLRWTDDEAGREYFKEQLLKSLEINLQCDNTMPV